MNTQELPVKFPIMPSLVPGISLWLRQVAAIFRIEFVKAIFSRRALSSYAIALLPVFIFATGAYVTDELGEPAFETIENARQLFSFVFATLIIGAVVFLGSAAIFTTLFRGEFLDRSIHYYLLTPVRREVLVVAKYLAGLVAAVTLFGLSTLISFLLLYVPFGSEQFITDLGNGIIVQQMGQYIGIILLGCMGYGAVFMAAGFVFSNPLIPVVVISSWEVIHFILPPALKIFSIIYYLKGLLPIPLDEGPLAVLVAPPPVWVSIGGMFGLCLIMISVSVLLLKRLEVRYTEE